MQITHDIPIFKLLRGRSLPRLFCNSFAFFHIGSLVSLSSVRFLIEWANGACRTGDGRVSIFLAQTWNSSNLSLKSPTSSTVGSVSVAFHVVGSWRYLRRQPCVPDFMPDGLRWRNQSRAVFGPLAAWVALCGPALHQNAPCSWRAKFSILGLATRAWLTRVKDLTRDA